MASVEIRGLPELNRKLEELEQAVGQMTDPTSDALELLRKRMQEYPAPPPGSTYERTFNLKNSWQETVIISGTTLIGNLFSNVPYGPYVQDEEQQAGIHQGRWQTIQSVLEEQEQATVNLYEQELERLVNK